MAQYMALLSSAKLKAHSDQLLENLRAGVRAPQNKLAEELSLEFIDVILQRLMFDMLEELDMSSLQESILRNLAALVKKTTHTLVHHIMKKMTNDELRDLVGYIEERELSLEEKGNTVYYIAFPLESTLARDLDDLFARIDAGEGEQVKAQYHQAMNRLVDQTLYYLMEQPMSYMKLGRIMSGMVNVAFGTIRKGQEMAMNKSIPALSAEEMKEHVRHMRKLLKNV